MKILITLFSADHCIIHWVLLLTLKQRGGHAFICPVETLFCEQFHTFVKYSPYLHWRQAALYSVLYILSLF